LSEQILNEVFSVIKDRKSNPRKGSYVNKLMKEGWKSIAQKIGEETTELIVASEGDDESSIVHESADLIFHLLVLLSFKEVPLSSVYKELERRRRGSQPSRQSEG